MTDPEVRLKCLEMAYQQIRVENPGGDLLENLAARQDWIYTRVVTTPDPAPPETKPGTKVEDIKAKADKKLPDLFK